MKFLKINTADIFITLAWIFAGCYTLTADTDSVSKSKYALLLVMFVVVSISNMIFKYEAVKQFDKKEKW